MQQAAADGHRVVVLHVFEPGLLDHHHRPAMSISMAVFGNMAGTFQPGGVAVSFVRL